MEINQTKDFDLIAKLNKPVHDLHYSLYPSYFNEYNYKAIKEEFKKLIEKKQFVFLLVEDNQQAVGYAWIEMKEYPESAL